MAAGEPPADVLALASEPGRCYGSRALPPFHRRGRAAAETLQLGGEVLEEACRFVERVRVDHAGAAQRAGLADSLRGIRALSITLISLPRLRVRLTASPSGRVIENRLRARRWGIAKNVIAQSVFPVPASEEDNLRRASRLVRRMVRRARESGVTCTPIRSQEERREVLDHLTGRIADMPEWVGRLPLRDDDQWWVARGRDGAPTAFAIVVVDREWAMLELLRSTGHPARYMLHTEIATAMAARGVRYVLSDSPMVFRLEPNYRQFQRMLGYRIAHLSLTRD